MHGSDQFRQNWRNPSTAFSAEEEEELLDDASDTWGDAGDSEPRVISDVSREPSLAIVASNRPIAPSRLRAVAGLSNVVGAAALPTGPLVSILCHMIATVLLIY